MIVNFWTCNISFNTLHLFLVDYYFQSIDKDIYFTTFTPVFIKRIHMLPKKIHMMHAAWSVNQEWNHVKNKLWKLKFSTLQIPLMACVFHHHWKFL